MYCRHACVWMSLRHGCDLFCLFLKKIMHQKSQSKAIQEESKSIIITKQPPELLASTTTDNCSSDYERKSLDRQTEREREKERQTERKRERERARRRKKEREKERQKERIKNRATRSIMAMMMLIRNSNSNSSSGRNNNKIRTSSSRRRRSVLAASKKKSTTSTVSIITITTVVIVIFLPLLMIVTTVLNQQLCVESFSFSSSYSRSRNARPSTTTTTTTVIKSASSVDNADTDTDASFGSTSNEEEEKEEAYINALIDEDSVLQYGDGTIKNGYSGTTSGYSPFLDKESYISTPKWFQPTKKFFHRRNERKVLRESKLNEMNEDGYGEMRRSSIGTVNSKRSYIKRVIKKPYRKLKKLITKDTTEPGTLILVRHGESIWNKNKTFTGWADPDLTIQGYREVEHAARLLMEGGYHYDIHVVFTSRLKRAIRSTWILLQEFNEVYLPVFKSWRLNERNYGALTGLSKTQTAERLGAELVQGWRGSLTKKPPPLDIKNDPIHYQQYYPGNDRKYADLTEDQIPLTESLKDCMIRTKPLWDDKIVYELKKGRNVLVVAHANTLRGLVKTIDDIGDEEIQNVQIPTGIPIIYKFKKDVDTGQLISIDDDDGGNSNLVSQVHMKGKFLEKPGLLKEALKLEEGWKARVPGYDPIMQRQIRPMTGLERSLYKLNAVRELGAWANEFIDLDMLKNNGDGKVGEDTDSNDDGNGIFFTTNGNGNNKIAPTTTAIVANNGRGDVGADIISDQEEDDVSSSAIVDDDDDDDDGDEDENENAVPTFFAQPCVVPDREGGTNNDDEVSSSGGSNTQTKRQDSVIVIIRHGKTQHNKLGLFTGWEDAPLAEEGIEEAKLAGRNLKKFGFEFDVVYTSWLSRALETAWFVMDEMDCLWLPIVKTWRLNERMYGNLTGLSKQMVKQRHGEKQFKAWRRGFDVRPPPVSSFSKDYPGNDPRYQKYLRDVRYSIKESCIRSIEKGKPVLVRKLPKTESLKDCMDRTLPYFIERIEKDAIDQNKRVLISSSENAIRGLLMHLCDIPQDEITGLEIPNGLPLIYDIRSKCVKLLDDGTGRDPMEVYNFGTSAKYLFRPCQNEDGSLDEECSINYDSMDTSRPSISSKDQAILDEITGKTTKTKTTV